MERVSGKSSSMIESMKKILARVKSNAPWRRRHSSSIAYPRDLDVEVVDTLEKVHNHTQTSTERLAALCEAVKYVVTSKIPGDIVECGVWRGGSMMAVAHTLQKLEHCSRDLYLFDTFSGMTEPGELDVALDGTLASDVLSHERKKDPAFAWCAAGLAEVRTNMASTDYPSKNIHYVAGKVEDTLPAAAPEQISLLRLDTDWYESTRHELDHLFPRLASGGVLIIDDYGHWQGARRAVDEYLEDHGIPMLLNRVDYTARIGVYHPRNEAA